jgi:hypothetical protein
VAKKQRRTGITDGEFDQLVADGFTPPPKRRRRGPQPEPVPDTIVKRLEEEGRADGLSKSEARFNALMCRCIGVKPGPVSDHSVRFLKAFDAHMRKLMKGRGIELRD